MAYNIALAEKIQKRMEKQKGFSQRKMFGGICYMINGNMACGIVGDDLMVRVGPKDYQRSLRRSHARPMDFTGRPLKGFVYVSAKGYDREAALKEWIGIGAQFARSLPTKL